MPDLPQSATAIAENGGSVWVGTSTGAYRIDGDNATRVPDFRIDIRGISVIDGVVWLATTQGAYRVDGDRAVRVPDKGLVVTSVTKVGDRIWLATTTGAYVVDGDTAQLTPDRDLDVASIVPIDENPWLATDRGAFRLTPTTVSRTLPSGVVQKVPGWAAAHVVDLDYDLNQILEIDGIPWLATDRGAFRIDPTGPKHIALAYPSDPHYTFPGKAAEVFRIIPAGGRVWFISTTGCFRVDGDTAIRIPDAKNNIATVVAGPGSKPSVWIATRTGAYRVDGDVVKRVPDLSLNVTGVTVVGGKVWLATSTGAYRVDGDTARRIPDEALSISAITNAGGKAVLSTSTGAVVVDGDRSYGVLAGGAVLGSNIAGGNVWLSTSTGAFRVDTDHEIQLRLVQQSSGFFVALGNLLSGGRVEGEYGVRVEAVDDRTGEARALPDATLRLEGAPDFVDPSTVSVHLRPGDRSIRGLVAVGQTPPLSVGVHTHVYPIWLAPVAILFLLWLGFFSFVIMTAPVLDVSWKLLQHPLYRTIGSLGLVSFFLKFPIGRRYMLGRYRRGLVDGLGAEPDPDAAVPLARIAEAEGLAHVGAIPGSESFVTACHIARRALAHDDRLGTKSHSMPVPLLVNGDEARDIDKLALQLLTDYGNVTDPGLARILLDGGGFLFIVEGDTPSTLDAPESQSFVQAFTDRYRAKNTICLVTRGE